MPACLSYNPVSYGMSVAVLVVPYGGRCTRRDRGVPPAQTLFPPRYHTYVLVVVKTSFPSGSLYDARSQYIPPGNYQEMGVTSDLCAKLPIARQSEPGVNAYRYTHAHFKPPENQDEKRSPPSTTLRTAIVSTPRNNPPRTPFFPRHPPSPVLYRMAAYWSQGGLRLAVGTGGPSYGECMKTGQPLPPWSSTPLKSFCGRGTATGG